MPSTIDCAISMRSNGSLCIGGRPPSATACSLVIAKAGKPLVKVTALDAPQVGQARRLGFLAGQIAVPDDFDRMGSAEIEKLFHGDR